MSGQASKVNDEGPASRSQCASIAANFIGCTFITTRALSWPLQITAPRAIAAIGSASDSEMRAMSRCCRRSRYPLETAAMNIAPVSSPALSVCVTLASAVGLRKISRSETICAPPAADFGADRMLHPGVQGDDARALEQHHRGEEPAGDGAVEGRLAVRERCQHQHQRHHRRRDHALHAHDRVDDLARMLAVAGPLLRELQPQRIARGHADQPREDEEAVPEPGRAPPVVPAGGDAQGVHDRHGDDQAEGQRDEDVVEADRQAELDPAQHQHERVRRHSSLGHGPTRTGRAYRQRPAPPEARLTIGCS